MLTQIPRLKAKTVTCGHSHIVVVDLEDNVWVCGLNYCGQLGLGNNYSSVLTQTPWKAKTVACGSDAFTGSAYTVIINLEDQLWVCGHNSCGQLGIGDHISRTVLTQVLGIKAKTVACGSYHMVVIDLEYNVWTCGGNDYGQLGLGDTDDRTVLTQVLGIKAKTVACGHSHIAVLDLEYLVWVCGQTGIGDYQSRTVLTQIPDIKANAIACGYGYNVLVK